MSPERRAKGGLGCPVSHPEHGDTLSFLRDCLSGSFHTLKPVTVALGTARQ
ncbi:MAG: hypothetical protein [Olavius algarvensis Gamma 1 endosymbiont]|nr:MAG: hypothetical protein [Olavius algarvensis Gamma 1 endosymbiont]